ncbi:MAG: SusC/RagA family TonB-linked outer membrane protein [Saprospiraceae bacterium]|nr:SusC/RagA family TonB-linked outer membrane protein [Saprospiraceae bacterium]
MKVYQQKFLLTLSFFLLWGAALLAQRELKGRVTDVENGEGLVGASVIVDGTSIGTSTDYDGNYSLRVPANAASVRVAYTGYQSQTITLGASNVLDIQLAPAGALEEVVVIGYGTVKREDLTGSVQAVGSRDFNKGAITGPQELLMGKIAGVQVTTGADPGGGATIRIRGGSSLSATNDPLVVIDGVPVANDEMSGTRNPLNLINPNDVETMTVLKDASATAIYGSRASNGVILITTKKGSAANRELRFSYSGNVAFSQIVQKSDVLSADAYRNLINSYYEAGHPATQLLGDANTDWQSEIYQTGITHDHNLAVTGAIGKLPFRASWGVTDREGILKTDRFKRVTGALNLTPSFLKGALQVNAGLKLVSDRNHFGNRDAIGASTQFDPTQPTTVEDQTYGGYFAWLNNDGKPNTLGTANPLALLYMKDDESHVGRYIASTTIDYRFWFLKDLRANLNVSYDYTHGQGTILIPQNAPFSQGDGGGRDESYYQKRKDKLLEFYLNYAKKFGRVNFDVMGGYSWQHFYRNNNSIAYNAERTAVIRPSNDSPREYYLVSLFSRANLSFNDVVYLTGSVRRDGTSRFPNNKWGLFPAAALAVKVWDREKALFSGLKLRLGYGVTGQQDISTDFYPALARYTYSFTNAQYQFGDQFYNTLRPSGYDANLKWEETTTYNAAVDYGFFENRITGSVEVYLRETRDLINFIPVPAGTNLTNFINTNVGDLENRGVEFSINALAIKRPSASWSVGFNIAANRNKITRLTATEDPNYQGVATGGIAGGVGNNIQIHSVGYPASSYFVYEQVYDASGVPVEGLYVDRNGDGVVTPDDRYRFEKPAPNYLMGFNTALYLKKWDFSLAGRSNIGNYMYNNNLSNNAFYNQLYGSTGVLRNVLSPTSEIDFVVPQYFSDHFIQDASFLRIDHITAGYTFGKVCKSIQNVRLSATVQNPILVTKYEGLDPEVFNGIDNNVYPRSRTYLVGLKADF